MFCDFQRVNVTNVLQSPKIGEKIDMCPKIVVIYNLSLLKVDYFVDVVFQIVKLP